MVETLRKRKKKIVRTKRKGGALNIFKARATSDHYLVNNHIIPDEIAVNRYILNNLYGLNGKIIQLPYPGEIFYAGDDRDLQSAFVCVQSCISGIKGSNDFNVLQQYARSGMFQALWLFSNSQIQSFAGEGSIDNYYENINNAIINFLSNYGYFANTKPFMGSHHEPNEISRIRTVSIGDHENNLENLYFLLDNITESCYYYSISEEDKKNNKNFLTNVKKHVIIDKEKNIESSFGLWENSSNFSYFYSVKYTHYIQSEEV